MKIQSKDNLVSAARTWMAARRAFKLPSLEVLFAKPEELPTDTRSNRYDVDYAGLRSTGPWSYIDYTVSGQPTFRITASAYGLNLRIVSLDMPAEFPPMWWVLRSLEILGQELVVIVQREEVRIHR